MRMMGKLPLPDPVGAARFGGDFLAAGLAAPFGGRPRPFLAEPFSSFGSAGGGAGFSAFLGGDFSTTASTFA